MIFGPLGLFYASKKGALFMLLFLVGLPVTLNMLGTAPGAPHPVNPFSILDNNAVMDRMWSLSAFFSVIWSVFAVRCHNKAVKARTEIAAEKASETAAAS